MLTLVWSRTIAFKLDREHFGSVYFMYREIRYTISLTLDTWQTLSDEKLHTIYNRIVNKIIELHYSIWNHHEKCIKISTQNMTGIDLVEVQVNVCNQWPCGKC